MARAMELAAPIIAETVKNIYNLGTAAALTGPIARGDARLVADQLAAVQQWDQHIAQIYKALGLVATELAAQKGVATPESLVRIGELIKSNQSETADSKSAENGKLF
jgi:predicted short-subunit dehydrogenase-like oxidoreductase (DUF2520 family)